ncbi:hypothetical protein GF366_02385 [Candidatus Peregrinibacteria bacterium]|nr:hypothetical protein [Candidatus Peregrinibacteria bacterium]
MNQNTLSKNENIGCDALITAEIATVQNPEDRLEGFYTQREAVNETVTATGAGIRIVVPGLRTIL